MATVYQEALKHRDWCPIQPQDCWTELPDATWNPLQRALLNGLPGERLEPKTFELPGVSVPRRLTSARVQRLKAEPGTNPLAFLMVPGFVVTSGAPKPVVHLFHAGGGGEVFRRILARGVALDRVEVACASDAHLAMVWEKALRYTWPVTLGAGIPAAFTRPGRALLGACDWIETDFSAGHLRRLLRSGDMSVEPHEGFTAGQAARRSACRVGGPHPALPLGSGYESRAADPEEHADRNAQENEAVAPDMGAILLLRCRSKETTARFHCRRSWTACSTSLSAGPHAAVRSIIGRPPRCRNRSASSARSAHSRARCPRRCGSSGNVSSRSRSRPSVLAQVTSTRRTYRKPATPAGRSSSSWARR